MNPYLKDFPILGEKRGDGKRLVYLDNAATTQKPLSVIRAVDDYYRFSNANPHRGLYGLSIRATQMYEDARSAARKFINAEKDAEVLFTRNASESLNLVAYSYGLNFIKGGEEIVLPVSEHHSNLLPWQMVARRNGAVLRYLYPDPDGTLPERELDKIGPRTALVAIAQVSNVLGTVYPIAEVVRRAHAAGAVVVLDAAQGVPHYPLDVRKLDVDFAAFSGHKMLAPMGIGVLYGKEELLEKMPPFLTGGEMIDSVSETDATFAPLPQKFEAGTQNVGGAVGLNAAIDYLKDVGYDTIEKTEHGLLAYALDGMAEIPHVTVYGDRTAGDRRCGVISFNVEGVHPHDVATVLDSDGVAVRAGHHCAQPLLAYMGINATCRASLYFYNTREDIDAFLASLRKVRGWLGLGT